MFSSREAPASADSCADFGANTLEVELDTAAATFTDDQCGSLSIAHGLGMEPLYLFLGAACPLLECGGELRVTQMSIIGLSQAGCCLMLTTSTLLIMGQSEHACSGPPA